jgi:tetratricopeptide (TPR) repeat protein
MFTKHNEADIMTPRKSSAYSNNDKQISMLRPGEKRMASKQKKYRNPYDFISPIRDPKLFAGRHGELEEIEYYLRLSKSEKPAHFHFALVGPSFAGKTSFLNIIEYTARDLGCLAVKISINKETVQNDVLFFKEVFDGILTKGAEKGLYGGITGSVYRAYRKVVDRLDTKAEAKIPFLYGSAYIGFKKKRNRGISQKVLLHDLEEIRREAQKKHIPTLVLLFDEGDLLADNHVLLQKIRNALMEVEGYILVFSGTENMFHSMNNVFSPLPRFFKRINVENFKNVKETEECLLKPLNDEEKRTFDRACIGEIHAITHGTPYEINLIAHYMYRKWKEGKNRYIALTAEVFDDVLKEIERFRKEGRHEIASKMKRYGEGLLEVLISSLEFPNVSKKWLAEFMLLEEMDTLQPEDVAAKKSMTMDLIKQLKKDHVLSEENAKLRFKGGPFDLLYLKYLCASRGVMNTKDFFMGSSEKPIFNLYHKLIENILLKDSPEYAIQTRFDRMEKVKRKQAEKLVIGARFPNLPAGTDTLLEISPESRNEFYVGAPHSVRFRVNVKWIKAGFVTQVKFKKGEDRKRFQSRLKALTNGLNCLGYDIVPEDEITWHNKGIEFLKQGKAREAAECFDKAIEINPSFELPWASKTKIFLDAQNYDEALEYANKALALHHDWGDALKLKGMIMINLGRNEEALEYLGKASEIDPKDFSIGDHQARALSNLGRYSEAIACADRSLKANQANHQLFGIKGLALLNLGRYDEALSCLNEALRMNPESTATLLAKGQVLLNLGQHGEAVNCLDAVLSKEWTNIDALISKGLALSKLGRHEEAIGCWDSIVQINRNNATGWYNKACFEAKMGYIDAALESLYKAIQIDKKTALEAKSEKDFADLRSDERFLNLTNLVWYASYGSNLCSRRFMSYLEGGQPDGASGSHPGCRDKTPPKDDQPVKISYPLYFAKQSSRWDGGGVAFIGFKKEETEATLGRMYLITEQQFIDVVSQENDGASISIDFQKARQQGSMVFHESWYGKIVYLGEQDGFPIYTFTSGKNIALETPVAPSPQYLQYIISGLKEVYPVTDEDIVKYLITRPGIKGHYTIGELAHLLGDGVQRV